MTGKRLANLLAIVGVAGVATPVDAARCWNPFGCGPTTYQECIQQAGESKTDTAAKTVISQCDRFKVTQEICEIDSRDYRYELAHPNQRMVDLRKKIPEIAGLEDYNAIEVVQRVYYPEIPLPQLAADLGVKDHPDRGLCERFHAELYK